MVLEDLRAMKETFWRNPRLRPAAEALAEAPVTAEEVADAAARLERFAPYIARVFPETRPAGGIIESPLTPIPAMQAALGSFPGRLLLKQDSRLPISGSIKARGGIYEVLCLAEEIGIREGGLTLAGDYAQLADPAVYGGGGRLAAIQRELKELTPVVEATVPDRPGGLNELLSAVAEAGIDIEYMYSAFQGQRNGLAYMVFRVGDAERLEDVLKNIS